MSNLVINALFMEYQYPRRDLRALHIIAKSVEVLTKLQNICQV